MKNNLKEKDQFNCEISSFENKYVFESLLTQVVHHAVKNKCFSTDENNSNEKNPGFISYCDSGESKTPILTDHNQLVPIMIDSKSYLPCHFHDSQGQRISSLLKLVQFSIRSDINLSTNVNENMVCESKMEINVTNSTGRVYRDIHLYSVPAGRIFTFAPSYVGVIINLPHVVGGIENKSVFLKVLSVEPKVFDIVNFFSMQESNALMEGILKETKESHRIKRSSTGATGYNLNERRTSENGFDTSSATSIKVKK